MHGSFEWKMSWALSNGCVQANTDLGVLDAAYLLCPARMQKAAPPMIASLRIDLVTGRPSNLGPIVRTPRDLEDCNVPQAPAMAIGVDRM